MSDAPLNPDTEEVDDALPAEDTQNFLGMTDEDIMNMMPSDEEPAMAPAAADDPEDDDVENPDLPDDGGAAPAESEEADNTADNSDEPAGEEDKAADTADAAPPQETDLKSFYEAMTSPLKANGKEYRFDKPEDLKRLISMGLNYNQKMGAMKPHRKTLKLLEDNGLLDEQKLSFLIDIEKKDPKAIAKLLKDSGIDPMDLDIEKDDYKPNTYSVDDREIELDQALEELQSSTQGVQVLETVTRKWDKASGQSIRENPGILHILNDHAASGVYDVIMSEVERRSVLGSFNGLSDLEAYKAVGDELHAKGGFDHLFTNNKGNDTPPAREVTPPPKAPDTPRDDKRRAARATRAAAPSRTKADFNPLAISDEEFEKQFNPNLM